MVPSEGMRSLEDPLDRRVSVHGLDLRTRPVRGPHHVGAAWRTMVRHQTDRAAPATRQMGGGAAVEDCRDDPDLVVD